MQPQPQQKPEPAHRRASSSACSSAPRRGIGCMAGLLRLISPYHRSHHRKRLTAKHNAAAQASAAPSQPSSPTKKKAVAAVVAAPSPSPAPPSPVKPTQQQPPAAVRRRRSCDAPRSPTIAPEHRRSSCDGPRPPPPAIVARLMGLEESAPPSPAAAAAPRPVVVPTRPPPPPPSPAPETAAEKRRKLLGALEKCDEDLKTLRRIIAAVRAAEMRAAAASDAAPAAAASPPAGNKCAAKWMVSRDENSPSPSPSPSPPTPTPQHHKPRAGEQQQQHPSPDSVLDAISSPRFPCRKRPSPCTDHDVGGKQAGCGGHGAAAPAAVRSKIVKPSRTLVFTGDYCKIKSSDESTLQLHAVGYPVVPLVVGMPRAAGAESWRHHRRRWELEGAAAGRVISRAMVESVGAEAMWGPPQGDGEQRRERGRVAAALERAVVDDLVAELLTDLLAQSGRGHGGGCRKRLCF